MKGMKKTISIFLIAAITVVFIPAFGIQVVSAAALKAPARVSNLKCKAQSSSSIKLTWKKVTNAKGYQVFRRTYGKKWKKIATLKSGSKRTYLNKSLKANTKYQYRVRAFKTYKSKGKLKYKYGKYSNTVSAKTKKPSSKTTTVNLVLCSDKNVTVTMTGIENGYIVLDVKNKSNMDYYFGCSYISFNGNFLYDDIMVSEIYAGKSRSVTIDDMNVGKYCFTGGKLKGRFYYYNDDTQDVGLTFSKSIRTSLPDCNTKPKTINKTLIVEDNNIALYKVSYNKNEFIFYIENKSSEDYNLGFNYLDFSGKTYYDEIYVTSVYSKTCKKYTVDDENIGKFTYSGGDVTGQVYYYNDDTNKKLNF